MLGLVALLSAGNPWGSESLLSLTRASAPAVTITPAANAPRTDDLAPAFLRQLAESAPTPPACDGSDICDPFPLYIYDVCDGSDICEPFPHEVCDGSDICDPFPDAPSPSPPIIAGTDVYPEAQATPDDDGNVAAYWMIPIAGVVVAVILLAAFGFFKPADASAATPAAKTPAKTPDIATVSSTATDEKMPVPVAITEVEIVTSK